MAKKPSTYELTRETVYADTCSAVRNAAEQGAIEFYALARSAYPGVTLRAKQLPKLQTAGYWDAKQPQGWGLGWHYNEGIELCYLSRGTLEFHVRDSRETQSHLLKANTVTLTRPWQQHKLGNPNLGANRLVWLILDVGVRRPHQGWEFPDWIILSQPDLAELANYIRQTHQYVLTPSDALAKAFRQMDRLFQETPEPDEAESALALAINGIFLELLRLFRKSRPALDQALVSARRDVEDFLAALERQCGEVWSVDEMAEEVGLGRTRFSHYCKQITNRNPVDYLNALRVERAKALLAQSGNTVVQVAMECGFSSSQYFAKIFRQYEGLSPREYVAKASTE